MLGTTHLLVVLLFVKVFNLDRNETVAALVFGVFIDLDHLLAYPDFIRQQGLSNAFNINAAVASNVTWKSLIHQPVAVLAVAPLAIGFRLLLPLTMWGIHLLLDWVQITYLGIASPIEMIFALGLATVLLAFEFQTFRATTPSRTSGSEFLGWEFGRVKSAGASLFRSGGNGQATTA